MTGVIGRPICFLTGAVFVAFSFPLGSKGNQLQLVEDYESYWPLTPAVEVAGGFQKRATIAIECTFTSRCLLLKLHCNTSMNCTCTPQGTIPFYCAHTKDREGKCVKNIKKARFWCEQECG